jgi:hypothetical protein
LEPVLRWGVPKALAHFSPPREYRIGCPITTRSARIEVSFGAIPESDNEPPAADVTKEVNEKELDTQDYIEVVFVRQL